MKTNATKTKKQVENPVHVAERPLVNYFISSDGFVHYSKEAALAYDNAWRRD